MSNAEWERGYYDAIEEFRAKRGEWARSILLIAEEISNSRHPAQGDSPWATELRRLAGEIRGDK